MESTYTTTPFGRRPMSLAMMKAQDQARHCAPDQVADKWKLFRDITEARPMLGVSDRALAVLHALLSFHRDVELESGTQLVVFPSNRELSLRAHGMSPVTLRRHLAALVEAGLIIRRDSPNGKRYVRRDQEGEISTAFGFDLTPLIARADEFRACAASIRAGQAARRLQHERISLHRRDLAKIMAFAEEEGLGSLLQGEWQGFFLRFAPLVRPLLRSLDAKELGEVETALLELRRDVENALEFHMNSSDINASDDQIERHIQNQNTDSSFDLEPGFRKIQGADAEPKPAAAESGEWMAKQARADGTSGDNPAEARPGQPVEMGPAPETKSWPPRRHGDGAAAAVASAPPTGYPLGMVLRACPDMANYARNGIAGWADLVTTARLVRSMLGISPDAWNQAVETMGEIQASIIIAVLLQRGEAISSPGGYLRSLTDKVRQGEFALGPVLMSLLRTRRMTEEARAG